MSFYYYHHNYFIIIIILIFTLYSVTRYSISYFYTINSIAISVSFWEELGVVGNGLKVSLTHIHR